MRFVWENSRFGVDAGVVAKTVQELEAAEGAVRPQRLVDVARPEESPVHGLFEWDDQVAAELHRVDQARRVMRSLRVVVQDNRREIAYVHVSTVVPGQRGPGGYVQSLRALSDETMRTQVLEDAARQLLGFRRRFMALQEFKPVIDAIDETVLEILGVQAE